MTSGGTTSGSGRAGRWSMSERQFLLLAVSVAALLRLAYVALAQPAPSPDSRTYLEAGRQLLAGQPVSSPLVMPLYPIFLVIVGWTLTPVVQALLSAATLPFVHRIARESFGSDRVARWAAGLMAIEPLSIYYTNQRLTETLFMLLFTAGLAALYRRRSLLASVLLVASVLVRPTLEPLLPVLVVLFCLRERTGRAVLGLAARRLALLGLVYAVLMAPWWWHNLHKYGQFVRLNLGDGVVLRVEHHPAFVAGGFWAQFPAVAEEFADVADPVARNRLQRQAALDFIREDPARYAGLALRRLVRFWSPVLYHGEAGDLLLRRSRWVFAGAACLVYAGVLLYALQRRDRRWRRIAPLLLVVGYLTAVHVAMHALVRYRAPLMPLIVVVAAAGWQRAVDRGGRAGPDRPPQAA